MRWAGTSVMLRAAILRARRADDDGRTVRGWAEERDHPERHAAPADDQIKILTDKVATRVT